MGWIFFSFLLFSTCLLLLLARPSSIDSILTNFGPMMISLMVDHITNVLFWRLLFSLHIIFSCFSRIPHCWFPWPLPTQLWYQWWFFSCFAGTRAHLHSCWLLPPRAIFSNLFPFRKVTPWSRSLVILSILTHSTSDSFFERRINFLVIKIIYH